MVFVAIVMCSLFAF
jgi:hypothetical protein